MKIWLNEKYEIVKDEERNFGRGNNYYDKVILYIPENAIILDNTLPTFIFENSCGKKYGPLMHSSPTKTEEGYTIFEIELSDAILSDKGKLTITIIINFYNTKTTTIYKSKNITTQGNVIDNVVFEGDAFIVGDAENVLKSLNKNLQSLNTRFENIEDNVNNSLVNFDALIEENEKEIKQEISIITSDIQRQIDGINAGQNLVDIVPNKEFLLNYNTQYINAGDKIQVLNDESHDNASTVYNYNGSYFDYIGYYGQNSYTKDQADNKFALKGDLAHKQDRLESGINIKTVNGKSLVGQGNIIIEAEGQDIDSTTPLSVKSLTTNEIEDYKGNRIFYTDETGKVYVNNIILEEEFSSKVSKIGDTMTGLLTASGGIALDQNTEQVSDTDYLLSMRNFSDGGKITYISKHDMVDQINSTFQNLSVGAGWNYIGVLESFGDASSVWITFLCGNGWNGSTNQNSWFQIMIKDGASSGTINACGVTVYRMNCEDVQVRVIAKSATSYRLYVYFPWNFNDYTYFVQGKYESYSARHRQEEPSTNDVQNLAYYDYDNAHAVQGYEPKTYNNFDGDSIPTRDANGSIYAPYYYSNAPVENPNLQNVFVDSGDGWIRKINYEIFTSRLFRQKLVWEGSSDSVNIRSMSDWSDGMYLIEFGIDGLTDNDLRCLAYIVNNVVINVSTNTRSTNLNRMWNITLHNGAAIIIDCKITNLDNTYRGIIKKVYKVL